MPMILISSDYLGVRNNVDLKMRNHMTLELGNDVNFLAIYLGNKVVVDNVRLRFSFRAFFILVYCYDGKESSTKGKDHSITSDPFFLVSVYHCNSSCGCQILGNPLFFFSVFIVFYAYSDSVLYGVIYKRDFILSAQDRECLFFTGKNESQLVKAQCYCLFMYVDRGYS
jgi:hypothetical protein